MFPRAREPKDPMGPLPILIPALFLFFLLHSAKPPENRGTCSRPGSPFQHLIVNDWITRLSVGHRRPKPHLSMAGLPSPLQKALA
ncbi:hypothetical protein BDP81DRAFT_423697 [Colletotrichum phormii]|uniref:Uncharacterized protein n=1 Tax=Colletotrichum phormii TaxID=359342 RepID=A0AAJ0EGD8_9PEZI|nr:uncharacterized protein BDP81DRAFT_423697 [Colletotrichum phormii]KAK1639217.1 hypothetical protein BDP81DRAFT_423697 [Colletotrichum phormii]